MQREAPLRSFGRYDSIFRHRTKILRSAATRHSHSHENIRTEFISPYSFHSVQTSTSTNVTHSAPTRRRHIPRVPSRWQKSMLVLGRHTHAAPCAAIASTSGGASRTVAERRCVQSAAHVQRHTWCIHAQSSGSVKWLNVHVHILSCLLPLKLGNEIRSQLYDCGFGGHHR